MDTQDRQCQATAYLFASCVVFSKAWLYTFYSPSMGIPLHNLLGLPEIIFLCDSNQQTNLHHDWPWGTDQEDAHRVEGPLYDWPGLQPHI